MASRCLNFSCVRSVYLKTLWANQKTFIPTSAKLQLRNVPIKNVAPRGLLNRPYSTPAPKAFFTPPKPLTDGRETLDVSKSVVDVAINNDSKQLVVSWEGGDSQIYPFVWLRDNCRCPKCFHQVALSRLTHVHQLNVDITAKSAGISQDGGGVTIHWDDDHQSQFPSYWLREYRFDRSSEDEIANPQRRYWNKDLQLKTFDFHQVMKDDRALYDWLTELVIGGIAVLTNTPREVGQVKKLGDRVAFLRACNYGLTWDVESKADPSNPAYTTATLALHTDLAYYINHPGVQLLHCIKQADGIGGENLLCDGFKVAMDLKKDDPDAFHLLTTVPFHYVDVGKDVYGQFHQKSRHPVIRLNDEGELQGICTSDHGRDPMLRAPVDKVLPIYRALNKYCNMLMGPENMFLYKMREGDMLTLDNRRVLHGRNSFQLTGENSGRHLQGSFLEWDEIYSRMRVLATEPQS